MNSWKQSVIARNEEIIIPLRKKLERLVFDLSEFDVKGGELFTHYVNKLRKCHASARGHLTTAERAIASFRSIPGNTDKEKDKLNDCITDMTDYINLAILDCDQAFECVDKALRYAPARSSSLTPGKRSANLKREKKEKQC